MKITESPDELLRIIGQVIKRNYNPAFLFKLLTKARCLEQAMHDREVAE